ncbi:MULTISPECIES: hypothetical protein [Marinomonas]|uniref:Uncharacterized protein n=1 Tax=Marinomonas arctica TaxID=383750 RepID=A0A7H1J231_9GAMM|nr:MULTISPECIES: hypothetical protein [Marinomonas]MCS7488208.1 hypothetical protein [Marinomonas sp. BSi20414]QNT04547.1 hypothetical protein IBG28_12530 [Marinomonas arctica]GGN36869.1 hypothetical protein GCM10011350_35490 [Marinomonas arctica]
MMIVDLVDEVDFKERLIALGAPVTQEQSLAEVQTAVLIWLQAYPEQMPFVKDLCSDMQKVNTTVLPDVSSVMAAFSLKFR